MHDDECCLPDPATEPSITAVILAGGLGTRMAPYTGPKCLVPIKGRPLIFYLIDSLLYRGIRHVIVCAGYQAAQVTEAVLTQYPDGRVTVSTAEDMEYATMGQRLEKAFAAIDTPHALVCYGDTLAPIDLGTMWEQYITQEAAMALATVPLKVDFGILDTDGIRVNKINEKPTLQYHVNIGYVLCQNWTFLRLQSSDSLVDWINRMAASDKVIRCHHPGIHVTVNSVRDIEEAEKALENTT